MFKEALHGAFQGHQTGQEQKGSLSMKGRKKLLQQIAYVVLLLAGIVSSALEIFFTISAAVFCRKLLEKVSMKNS